MINRRSRCGRGVGPRRSLVDAESHSRSVIGPYGAVHGDRCAWFSILRGRMEAQWSTHTLEVERCRIARRARGRRVHVLDRCTP